MQNETKNDSQALRGLLFDTLRGLKDGSVSIEQAKAVSDVSRTVISLAKIELDHIRATEEGRSEFFEGEAKTLPSGYLSVTQYKKAG